MVKKCDKCKKPITRYPDNPLLWQGVFCSKCKKIECYECKGWPINLPCSWYGAHVLAVAENNPLDKLLK